MVNNDAIQLDAMIFGGGVAGLWILNRMRREGRSVALIETVRLGGGQTIASQGIIHGGTKYTLRGRLTGASERVAGMPARWRACLDGHGEIDLRGVAVRSDHHYLWAAGGAASNAITFLAGHAMRSRARRVEGAALPAAFRDQRFTGRVFELDEPVIDPSSLIHALAKPHERLLFHVPSPDMIEVARRSEDPAMPWRVTLSDSSGGAGPSRRRRIAIETRRLIITAGAGNEAYIERLGVGEKSAMAQRRPLHMVMARGAALPPLFAHAIGASDKPLLTITSAYDAAGRVVWYIGGEIAETPGVARDEDAQCAAAAALIRERLSWVDTSDAEWSTLRVDRAEPREPGGRRPDTCVAIERDGVIVAWPTKLALAPALADEVSAIVNESPPPPVSASRGAPGVESLPGDWPRPTIAPLPWEEPHAWRRVPSD